ncbi:hypothetical protein [Streptomyces sp. NPDC056549]|uniref:hypothetical protein n=1 Tax=Streptomyces sp. NPDC056549 TaxID=3345864 RepID=UPI00368D3966
MWDFAELSEEASRLGGPAALRAAYIEKGFQKAVQLGAQSLRQGRIQGFVGGVLAVGVPVAGWKVFKKFRHRRAAAAPQPVVAVSETATTTEEAVIAAAESVVATAEGARVADEPEPDVESSSPASAQSTPAAGEQPSA